MSKTPQQDRLNGPVENGKGGSSSPGDHHSSPHGTQGLKQLCVIVEKDGLGYGLTVSGDKPVHVQSVKENGASARAGVRTGDRIYKVNGASVANYDHTEVVNLIKAGSHVALTLLRKPDQQRLLKTPTSPGAISVGSGGKNGGGSDRITHPIPVDEKKEQDLTNQKVETFKKMYEEAAAAERKLQNDYLKNRNSKTEAKLQHAKTTTGAIRKQLDQLTGGQGPTTPETVSMPSAVDVTDSSHILRSPGIHTTIGEYPSSSIATSPIFDDTDEESSLRRLSSTSTTHRMSNNPASEIFSMDDDDFSPDSQTVVKDHGPFIDFELLRNRHAHCSVFLSFLISNADPAPMLFTLISELYKNGSIREMRRWAYEIHSTFILKDAPLDIKLSDAIVEDIENLLNSNTDREDLWKKVFDKARNFASGSVSQALADFRQKRELGLGNFFGDGELRDDLDKTQEQRIVEKTLRPHFDRFAADENSARSVAMVYSLTTVLKEWGIQKSMDRQLSFAVRDKDSQRSLKGFLNSKMSSKSKKEGNHHFNQVSFQQTTSCDHCGIVIWGIGYQGYNCTNCNMNIHKDCISLVEPCNKKKKRKSIIPKRPGQSGPGTSSASMLTEDPREPAQSMSNEEDGLPNQWVKNVVEKIEGGHLPGQTPTNTQANGEVRAGGGNNVGRSESFNVSSMRKKSDKMKDGRKNKSDVDKDKDNIMSAIDQSRSNSSTSSLSTRSDSSSTEKVCVDIPKQAPIEEDSDLEVEESMPPLDSVIRKELLRKMKPKEKKLQEVINELFYTERSHVRNLKLLDKLFHLPMARADFCSKELVDLVFPAIQAIIEVHVQLNNDMKAIMKELIPKEDPLVSVKDVASILLKRFDGDAGDKMKDACALFCRNHAYALQVIKEKRKSQTKIHELLSAGETNPMCRRLQFKDLMISEVHRLTKYPLLIDSMSNHTTTSSEEHLLLAKAAKCSRNILTGVNHEVRDCENHHKLVNLQKRLDTKQIQNSQNPLVAGYKNLNLTDYKLIYDGAFTWRLNQSKQINLHVILLEEIMVLLQVQDDSKLVLKCQSQVATSGGASKDEGKFGHSPIILLHSTIVRPVATDKKAIYIIQNNIESRLGPQIFELVASSVEEKKRWIRYISEAADKEKKTNTIPRPRQSTVNKTNLTLTEATNDESSTDPASDSAVKTEDANITTNNNVTVESCNSWEDSPPPPYSQISQTDTDAEEQSGKQKSTTAEALTEQDEIIRKAMNEKRRLLGMPGSVASNSTEDVLEDRESENAQLKHQLQTAEQLLREAPKELGDSRPNSFVSNSSSSAASAGETSSDSQINAMSSSSLPVINTSKSAPSSALPSVSSPVEDNIQSDEDSSSSSTADSDSDDETVYADTKDDLNTAEGHDEVKQRPDSVMSDVSNSHTDNTLISTENLADTVEDVQQQQNKNSSNSNVTDSENEVELDAGEAGVTTQSNTNPAVIPQVEVKVHSASSSDNENSSGDEESENEEEQIEQSNIDDIVTTPPPVVGDVVMNEVHDECDTKISPPATESEIQTASKVVDEAMKAALDQFKSEQSDDTDDNGEDVDDESHPLDCDNIDIDVASDSEQTDKLEVPPGAGDIDDSDESDALSASSLD